VSWPDGKKDTLNNLEADRFYSVREGDGIISSQQAQTAKTKSP